MHVEALKQGNTGSVTGVGIVVFRPEAAVESRAGHEILLVNEVIRMEVLAVIGVLGQFSCDQIPGRHVGYQQGSGARGEERMHHYLHSRR